MKAVAKGGHQATAASGPNNLPRYLTSFVGRQDEIRALKSLLDGARMVTLTGMGGAGKTRLAVELAGISVNRWRDGVWWVDLAPLEDPGLVAGAVVGALELPGQGSAMDVLTSWLASRQALLILDNCEHMVAACAEFCDRVLKACPQLTIITTSREVLGVSGEASWLVSPLPAVDATRLFELRARLVVPTFKLEAPNRDAVGEICERLDHLPLAIELAAPRLNMMSEREILSQLADRFPLLTQGVRSAPSRQRTLMSTIDWSYQLLTDGESRLLRSLAVFRGGFTLEAVSAICADGDAAGALQLLTGLAQKSMVVPERMETGESRYGLLESVLTYAADRLRDAGELEPIRRRHYEYFLAELSSRTVSWTGPRAEASPGVADELWKARESQNLWAAVDWARDHTKEMGLSLAYEVANFDFADPTRARKVLVDLLNRSPATGALRAMAFTRAAALAWKQGDYDTALDLGEKGLALGREVGDPEVMAHILLRTGNVHHARLELTTAGHMYDEALVLLEGARNQRLVMSVKNSLAMLAVQQGDYEAAVQSLNECVAASRSSNNALGLAFYLESLASAQFGLNDYAGAATGWSESLSISLDLGNHFCMILCLAGLSRLAGATGADERALRLAAAANRVAREWSLKPDPWVVERLEEAQTRSRTRLGTRRSDQVWHEGEAMKLERAVDYALGGVQPEALTETGPLSRREREVARLVAIGMTNRQIGERLFIAERTAEGHVERLRNKLGVRSRAEVAAWAVSNGLAGVDAPHRDR